MQYLEAMQKVFNEHKEFGVFSNPWNFPKDTDYKQLLEENHFNVEYIELIPRPTKIDDISNWLDIEKDGWVADYVRLRFKAIKRV